MKSRADEADAGAGAAASASDADSSFDSMLRKIAHVSQMSADPPLPRLGQVIGEKYRVEARLGRGGMGVVYRATHLVSRKAVALKWMLRSTADGSAHRRFLREALAAGRIDHPNVVDVYDVGQDGVCAYLVMELLHGETLRARLDRGRLEPSEAVDLLLPALRGVSAAHRAGVIHRDLKPDNIFLCTDPDGSAREAKVLDFGVSAVLVQSALQPTLTDGATILGTPAYMSPEQLVSSQDADERTDVYAFGVMLYEALTGRLPFVADSYSGLVLAVARDLPKAPSEVCSSIPIELTRVILQALSKQREGRPQTVDALRDLLAPFGSAQRRADLDGAGAPARRASSSRTSSSRAGEAGADASPRDLLAPDDVFASRYRVRRCIAQGNRGATFEAEHITTERRVALKLFPQLVSVGDARKPFELEAKISARVNSPYIVEVLDAGYDEETELPFLVMELLEGQTLEEWVRREGPLDVDPALRLLQQVASGLDAAHAHRGPSGEVKPIIHRDLKPENLFLARQHDRSVVTKILGYGIAKVFGEPGTIARELRGTPHYMAFEQITGRTLLPQTDVWALGLTAFFMLTGARYWSAGYGDSGVQALFSEILSSPRQAPSVRLREQGSSVELPPAFDAWMLRCIARDPLQRFASAGEAVRALSQVFELAPRAAFKPSPAPISERLQTIPELDAVPESSGLPGTAQHTHAPRRTTRPPSALGRSLLAAPMHWVVIGAASCGLLLGALGWMVTRGTSAAVRPTAVTSTTATSRTATSTTAGAAPPAAGDEPLPSAASKPQVRPLLGSAAALPAVPQGDDALDDWAPAAAPLETDPAEASMHARELPRELLPQELGPRRALAAKEGPLAASTSSARSRQHNSRPHNERVRKETTARPERSAADPNPESLPEPGLAEAYDTR